MNKRLKAKWVKALRSGKYKQGAGSLTMKLPSGESGFCCLRVLREIDPALTTCDEGGCYLNEHVIGIPITTQMTLAAYNDNGKSFNWIASNIERRTKL